MNPMKPEVLQPKNVTETQTISFVTLILLLISFLWLFFKIYAYNEIRAGAESLDFIYDGIAFGNFLKFILLISFGILLGRALRRNIRIDWLAFFSLISGLLSLLFMYADWAALHDIFNGEPDTHLEWSILRIGLIVNFIFYIIGFITILRIRQEVRAH
jgi:hypothetical protein